jgi:hypothetical protein
MDLSSEHLQIISMIILDILWLLPRLASDDIDWHHDESLTYMHDFLLLEDTHKQMHYWSFIGSFSILYWSLAF